MTTHAAGFGKGTFLSVCGADGPMDTKPEGVTCLECRKMLGLGRPSNVVQLLQEALRLLDNASPHVRLRYVEAQAMSDWRTRRDSLVREVRAFVDSRLAKEATDG